MAWVLSGWTPSSAFAKPCVPGRFPARHLAQRLAWCLAQRLGQRLAWCLAWRPSGCLLVVLLLAWPTAVLATVSLPPGSAPGPSSRLPAGAHDGRLVFGFVITPGADSARAAVLVSMLERRFALHNQGLEGRARDSWPRAARTWHLAVFRLQAGAADWAEQLAQQLARRPVFALVGGTGTGDWSPIDRYCSQHGLPLLLPAIEAPPAVPGAVSLYFHPGVLLDAKRLAAFLLTDRSDPRAPVWQVARPGDSGAAGARALAHALVGQVAVQTDWLTDAAGIPAAPPTEPADCVLWLRPIDLRPWLSSPLCRRLFVSGVLLPDLPDPLAGLPVASSLIDHLWLTYPWELPGRRQAAMGPPQAWLRRQGLPERDARAQTDLWLSMEALETALASLQGAYFAEGLLRQMRGALTLRSANAHYRELRPAAEQAWASRGSYLLRWTGVNGWQPEDGWVLP